MTKTDLIDEVWASNRALPYMTVRAIVERVFSTIEDELLSGGKVVVNGFGTFEIRDKVKSLEQSRASLLATAEDLASVVDDMPRPTDIKSRVEKLAKKNSR